MKVPSGKSRTIGRTYYNEIQPIEIFAEFESAINFKGFEALHNIVLDIAYQFLCFDVQIEPRQTYDDCLTLST